MTDVDETTVKDKGDQEIMGVEAIEEKLAMKTENYNNN